LRRKYKNKILKVGGRQREMTTNRLVIRGSYCHWRAKTNSNTNKKEILSRGFINPWFVVVIFILFASLYLYFINSSATKGYQVRQIEKEISDLKNEGEQLKIQEAQLKSLYHIEETSKNLNLAETQQVSYINEKSPVAMR
jgi:hypothetical protein